MQGPRHTRAVRLEQLLAEIQVEARVAALEAPRQPAKASRRAFMEIVRLAEHCQRQVEALGLTARRPAVQGSVEVAVDRVGRTGREAVRGEG